MEIKTNDQGGKSIPVNKLDNGESIIVTKDKYIDGREANGKYGPCWVCSVNYEDEDVVFFLNKEEEAQAFASTGGIGDKVMITMTKEMFTNSQGKDGVRKNLSFEKVE